MEKKYNHVIAPGKSVTTKRGGLAPGAGVEPKDLANPQHFDLLMNAGLIVKAESFVDNETAQYRKAEKVEDKKEEKKVSKKKEGSIKAPIK